MTAPPTDTTDKEPIMTYTVTHIRPDKTAELFDPRYTSVKVAAIKAAAHLSVVTRDVYAGTGFDVKLLAAYTRANATLSEGEGPIGAELTHESGHTYRIDHSDSPPNICPCCGGLVRPSDHASAGDDDAFCLGCFTWGDDSKISCDPNHTAHPNPWTTSPSGARFCMEVVTDQGDETGHDVRYSRTDSFDDMWDETENALVAWPGLTEDQLISVTITEIQKG